MAFRPALHGLSAMLLLSACFSVASDDEGTSAPPPASGGPDAPAPLALPGDAEAVRFLTQASFGATDEEIATLKEIGYEEWYLRELNEPSDPVVERMWRHEDAGHSIYSRHPSQLFWDRAIYAEDQLRQRVAYALSQIVVVSTVGGPTQNRGVTVGSYMDILQEEALGNYCDLVRRVSLNPAMGLYLSHLKNEPAKPERGSLPDENYAREVMQLFTIGLEKLGPDGTPLGEETYTDEDVRGLAAVFTGFSWAGEKFRWQKVERVNEAAPMQGFADYHEAAPKSFLGTTIDLGADPEASVAAALDHLLSQPEVAPFISRQLIQKLVTSNPSPAYIERVVGAFEAGRYTLPGGRGVGAGRRCDLAATVAAILFDEEARDPAYTDSPDYGKLKEPVLRMTQLMRAFAVDRDMSRFGEIPSFSKLNDAQNADRLGQNAYRSPSVFNFYRPGYVAAGLASADAGLVAPEFQMATATPTIGYINLVRDLARGRLADRAVLRTDFKEEMFLADDAERLVDRLDLYLSGGRLADDTKARIVEALGEIEIAGNNTDRDRARRVEIALVMVATAPEFMVQK